MSWPLCVCYMASPSTTEATQDLHNQGTDSLLKICMEVSVFHTTIVIAMRYWGEGRTTDNTSLELKSSNENSNEGVIAPWSGQILAFSWWGGGDHLITRLL